MYVILVYQAGIANVFKVTSLNLADFGRDAQRLLQGSFGECINFARGMAAAGACVRTAHCDQAGDIAHAQWKDGKGTMFSEHRVELTLNNENPKCLGFWVVDVQGEELIKWGKDGDTEYPYPTEQAARDQAAYLKEQSRKACLYILQVFDNGQILTIET